MTLANPIEEILVASKSISRKKPRFRCTARSKLVAMIYPRCYLRPCLNLPIELEMQDEVDNRFLLDSRCCVAFETSLAVFDNATL